MVKALPQLADPLDNHFHVHVGPGKNISGRVLVHPGKPAVGVHVVLHGSAMHYRQKNARHLNGYVFTPRTDAEGRFRLHSILEEYPPVLELVLDSPDCVASDRPSPGA